MNQLTNQTTAGLPVVSETLGTLVTRGATRTGEGREAKPIIFKSDFVERGGANATSADSLFEHFAWLYILWREKLFRDDTNRMIRALWPNGGPVSGTQLIEFGCGPGFYSSRLAKTFPEISVLGIDSSESQLDWARAKARSRNPRQVAPGRCALAVMTKVPRAGKVKTRLTPPLTPAEAAELNTCFLRDTAEAIFAASRKGDSAGIAVYTPVGEEESYRGVLPDEFQLVAQRGDGFGERLIFATKDLLALGFESICLIDSDSPTVPLQFYEEAARRLAQAGDRIVLGPSDDGGYYLIGMKKPHGDVFQQIDWSTKHVFSQTLERAAGMGVEVEALPAWYDVDDSLTLSRLCQELFGSDSKASGAYEAPHTRSYLSELLRREGRARIWPNE